MPTEAAIADSMKMMKLGNYSVANGSFGFAYA